MGATRVADAKAAPGPVRSGVLLEDPDFMRKWVKLAPTEKEELFRDLEKKMFDAAAQLEFERAADLRDQIDGLRMNETMRKRSGERDKIKK